ncbi:hypothetical protein CKAH01_11108 [Colletotrichum kahawae]|uniref:Secreted protein n=1 Tax=Colletotrichum kahawae TaxID=34407 RepID=A0AAE0CWR0_COLKA|nr:hypothetical protein CKAH01_11108 [Colletotrichum kahawae]
MRGRGAFFSGLFLAAATLESRGPTPSQNSHANCKHRAQHAPVRASGRQRRVRCLQWEAANVKVNQLWSGCAWPSASSLHTLEALACKSLTLCSTLCDHLLRSTQYGVSERERLVLGVVGRPRHSVSGVAWPIQHARHDGQLIFSAPFPIPSLSVNRPSAWPD